MEGRRNQARFKELIQRGEERERRRQEEQLAARRKQGEQKQEVEARGEEQEQPESPVVLMVQGRKLECEAR